MPFSGSGGSLEDGLDIKMSVFLGQFKVVAAVGCRGEPDRLFKIWILLGKLMSFWSP